MVPVSKAFPTVAATADTVATKQVTYRSLFQYPVAAGGGRIMGSLAGHGGLAGVGGIAGKRGGIAA